MTWFQVSANETEANKTRCAPIIAVDMDWPSGHVRCHSAAGTLTILGNTFTGVGELGKVGVAPSRIGLDATRKTYELSYTDVSLIPESEIDASFGRSVTEYLLFMNMDTGQLVANPEIEWEGRIDSVQRMDGGSPIIRVNAEERMILLEQNDVWRWTHEHQQRFYSGDDGFNQVNTLDSKKLVWGGHPALSTPGPQTRNPLPRANQP